MAKLILIWDYDSALGQVNATYPYKFDHEKLYNEIENVEYILKVARIHQIKMVFACLGFAAEKGPYPFCIPDQIRKISEQGHEIASHSWKHEWFPYLEREQIQRSLERSKFALETCIGKQGTVVGFVPPFNRPMSWYGKGAFSLGDRAFYPYSTGANLGSLLKFLHTANYHWCRVSYRPLWKHFSRFEKRVNLNRKLVTANGIICIRSDYCGFDKPALDLLDELVNQGGTLIISAHPSGLSRNREENLDHFKMFIHKVTQLQDAGILYSSTIRDYLKTIK